MGDYLIRVDNGKIQDRAGNRLLNNDIDGAGSTAFTIALLDVPGKPTILTPPTLGHLQVDLAWTAAVANGDPILRYYVETSSDNGVSWADVPGSPFSAPTTSATVTGLADGTKYRFRVRAENGLGISEWSDEVEITAQKDETAPVVVIDAVKDNVEPTTGTVPSGGFTNDTTLEITGTIDEKLDVEVFDGATTLGTVPKANLVVEGTKFRWTYQTAARPAGGRQFSAWATDAAENQGKSAVYTVTIDTTAPTVAITMVQDDKGPTTGDVPNGGVTDDSTLKLTGTVDEQLDVEIYDGNIKLGTVLKNALVNNAGAWTWTHMTRNLGPGIHSFTARASDVAGNRGTSTARALTIDGDAAAPVLTLAQDTGRSATDRITRDGRINVLGLEPGATWWYRVNKGAWTPIIGLPATTTSFTVPAGAYAANTIEAYQKDAAGNVSDVGTYASALTVDTTAAAPSLTLAEDTGKSTTDRITRNGRMNVGLEPGATWEYSTNSGGTWVAGSGSFFTLSPGTYAANAIRVRQTDVAGNVSTNANNAGTYTSLLTIDQTPPAAPGVALSQDTGASGSDGVTKNPVVTVSGLEATRTRWEFSIDSGKTWTPRTSDNTFSLGVGTYGTNVIRVRQVDEAGNVSPIGLNPRQFVIDTSAAAPTLKLSIDTGVSSTDGVTSNGRIDVSGLEIGATWQYSTDSGNTWIAGSGNFFTLPASRTYAANSVRVRQTDRAGNLSANGLLASSVTVDTAAGTPGLKLSSDTGASSTDGITSNGRIDVSGLETGATWQYSINSGVTWTAGSGDFFTLPAGRTYASNTVRVRQADKAGNISAVGQYPSAISVDIAPPAAPTVFLALDTGASMTDGITSSGLMTVSNLEAGAKWQFSTNGGTSWSNGTGSSFTLPAATYVAGAIRVRQSDVAGNTSPEATYATAMTVDTTSATVEMVTSSVDNGTTYGFGSQLEIPIQVVFKEPVVVAGKPTLKLNTAPTRTATYLEGSGTSTLTFVYSIQFGDKATRLGYAATNSLELNGGTIGDLAGNPATLTLPATGAAGSLSVIKNIRIDTIITATATVAGVALSKAANSPTTITSPVTSITLQFNADVDGVTTGIEDLRLYRGTQLVTLPATALLTRVSGNTYRLSLPSSITSIAGTYRLEIGGPSSMIMAGEMPMISAQTFCWRRA